MARPYYGGGEGRWRWAGDDRSREFSREEFWPRGEGERQEEGREGWRDPERWGGRGEERWGSERGGYGGERGGGYGERYGSGGGERGYSSSSYGRGAEERWGGERGGGYGYGGERGGGGYGGERGGYGPGYGRGGEDRWSGERYGGFMGGMMGGAYGSGRGEERWEGRGSGEDWRRHDERGPLERLGEKVKEGFRKLGRGPKGYRRSDDRIKEEVCERIARAGIDADEVEVKVEKAEVTLTGTVNTRDEKRWLEDLAEDVYGVDEVHNQLRTNRGGTSGQSAMQGQSGMTGQSGAQPQTGSPGQAGMAGQQQQQGTTATRTGRQ
jgi:hypothetical protein